MFFLYHRRSAPTGTKLAEALRTAHGVLAPGEGFDTVIRWGSRGPAAASREINPRAAIKKASDKLGSLGLMKAAGVRVPDWDTDPRALMARVNGRPIIGRKREHARGTDIVLVLQERDLRTARDYYVEYIPTKREYRIHVAFGQVIRVQGKFLDQPSEAEAHIRNYEHGYRFRAPRKKLNSSRLSAAVKAVEAHGLDFGAVDLIVGDDGKEYVLEVNTSPACSPITAGAYVVAIADHLGISTEELHLHALDMLSPDQEERDSDDEVPGEGMTEAELEAELA